MTEQLNVFGEKLIACNCKPKTGFYRDGYCHYGEEDYGMHSVCVEVTDEFLQYSKQVGNDLSTPIPEYGFPGLKAGDRWCLCATRYKQAFDAGVAPFVILTATNIITLEVIPLESLKAKALDLD